VGFAGQGSVVKEYSAFPTASRSRRAQCGVGGGSMTASGLRVITHGTWSELVEGRGVSYVETRGEREVLGEGQVQDRGTRNGVKREPSINPWGVEKVVWDVESGVKIACGDSKFPFGQGAAGISQRVVKVEVA